MILYTRLMTHHYKVRVHATPLQLSLNNIFSAYFEGIKVKKVTEYNLIGNFPLASRKRLVWPTKEGPEEKQNSSVSGTIDI